jgi:hypothetical protein
MGGGARGWIWVGEERCTTMMGVLEWLGLNWIGCYWCYWCCYK